MRERIKSFNGLKVLAILAIVWWHRGAHIFRPFDLGARMCEFFFIISGFLVGYNGFDKVKIGLYATLNHKKSFFKKLFQVWPLHIIVLILYVVRKLIEKGGLDMRMLPTFFSNFFLLQAWSTSESVYFSYNGATWFLGALMFCYLISPVLVSELKNFKTSSVLFFVVVIIRMGLELLYKYLYFQPFPFIMHTSPIIRGLEFAIGLFAVPMFCRINDKISNVSKKKKTVIFSIIEIVVLGLSIYFMCVKDGVWLKGIFVLILLLVVFTFAFQGGIVSYLLSHQPFTFLSNIQFEIYITHNIVGVAVTAIINKFIPILNKQIPIVIATYVAIIAICFLYKKFVAPHITKLTNKLLDKLFPTNELNDNTIEQIK